MGTATAPRHGPARGARASSVRFIRRAFRLNAGGAPGSVERRAFGRFAAVVPIANLCGAIDIFLFLWLVAPLPPADDLPQVRRRNTTPFAAALLITFTVCGSLSNKAGEPIARWLDAGKP